MGSRFAIFVATVLCASSAALAQTSPVLPLASHRAAYDISLARCLGSDTIVRPDANLRHRPHRV